MIPSTNDSIHNSEAKSAPCIDVPSQTLSDTIRKRDRLRRALNETNIKFYTLELDAAIFDTQKECAPRTYEIPLEQAESQKSREEQSEDNLQAANLYASLG